MWSHYNDLVLFMGVILSARAGLGPTLPHTESRIEGQSQEQYELSLLRSAFSLRQESHSFVLLWLNSLSPTIPNQHESRPVEWTRV